MSNRFARSESVAAAWNEHHPPGTPVFLTEDDGETTETKTRSVAWVLGHGEAVVSVKGKSGGYQLSRIVPAAAERKP